MEFLKPHAQQRVPSDKDPRIPSMADDARKRFGLRDPVCHLLLRRQFPDQILFLVDLCHRREQVAGIPLCQFGDGVDAGCFE